ncbi:hypothetical protein DFR52_101237 [Hoeflea marina]|uniref:Uncharacterized protein n=1 Tax=Hoeflea marina TaxID=274592 RepID=A0A317PTK1_9HYPH|nr:hypothetical protein [Hoeflea marina]PWW03556.1 hypothetical protein DFR52_101237 [Hoeflea marina]
MFKKLAFAIGLLVVIPAAQAAAASKTYHHPTITMKAGNRAGLQNVFAWDAKCRSVQVSVQASKPKMGQVYLYKSSFKIPASQSRECAGRTVRGYKVVFKADKKAKGSTLVKYQIQSKNVDGTFKFRRTLRIK